MHKSMAWSLLVLLNVGCDDDKEDTGTEGADSAEEDTEVEEEERIYEGALTLTEDEVVVPLNGTNIVDVEGSATISDDEISGTVLYQTSQTGAFATDDDGDNSCDNSIAFTGSAYTGDCDGCDFSFQVDETEVTVGENSTDACVMNELLSLVDDPEQARDSFLLRFDAEYVYGTYTITDLFQIGYSAYSGGTDYPGPYYYTIYYGGVGGGNTVSYDASTGALEWSIYDRFDFYFPDERYDSLCSPYSYASGNASYAGPDALSGSGTVDCVGGGDVWTLSDVVAGDRLKISIDTVAANTAFDPRFFVNAESGCTAAWAYSNLECTHGTEDGNSCGALRFNAPEDGDYQLIVWSMNRCNEGQESGEYELSVEVEPR
ncbi:MAG: hypothetical protein AAFV53_01430 [Myxococcota bacterium]